MAEKARHIFCLILVMALFMLPQGINVGEAFYAGPEVSGGEELINDTYGSALGSYGLANFTLYGSKELGYRFRAERSETLESVAFHLIFAKDYYKGDGGDVLVELREDDGTENHFPSETVLASYRITNPMGFDGDADYEGHKVEEWDTDEPANKRYRGSFPVIALLDNDGHKPVLEKGTIYHIVFSNPSQDPIHNYVSVNRLTSRPPMPDMPAVIKDIDLADMWRTQSTATWTVTNTIAPIVCISYSDGEKQGQGYVGASIGARLYGEVLIYGVFDIAGSGIVKEEFTVSKDEDISSVFVYLRKPTGVNTGDLALRLEDSSGTLIEEGTISASSIEDGRVWVTYDFTNSHHLSVGESYNIIISAPEGDPYRIYKISIGGELIPSTVNIAGNDVVRETFTVSGKDRIVKSVSVRLEKPAGTNPKDLTIRLERDNEGMIKVLEEDVISAGSIGEGKTWVNYNFSNSHTLEVGKTYNLVLTAESGNPYKIYCIQEGTDYLGLTVGLFKDGYAQYSKDSGSSWDFFNIGYAGDLQFYFDTVAPDTDGDVNRAPVLEEIGNRSVNENSLLTFAVNASDPDGEVMDYSAANLPSGAVFASQTFTWIPSYDQKGTYDVTFIASDSEAQDSQTITITVNNANREPVLDAIGDKSVYVNELSAFTVTATDPDGDAIEYAVQRLPIGATFINQNFSWEPTSDQVGNHEITFIASDGELEDSETITIAVNATDTSPPAVANPSPAANEIQVPSNRILTLRIVDTGKGVDANSVTIKVNNNTVYTGNTADYSSEYGPCRRRGNKADYKFIYRPDERFDYDQAVTVTVNAADLAGNTMSEYSYSFTTEMRPFGENKKVSASDNLYKGSPATVRDSGGDIWAVWHAGPTGGRDIYVGKLTAGADSFGSSVQLTSNTANQCNPDIAVDSDDQLYVVWQDNRRGTWDIYVATSTNGTNWSAEKRVTDSNDNQVNPAIVIDGSLSNNAYVVWQDDRAGNQDIYVAKSSNSFVTKAVSRITSDSSDQTVPAIAADSDNTVYIVWTDARNGSTDIYGAASNNGPWAEVPIVSNTANQSRPAIATEAAGSILHLLWVDGISGDRDIYYAASDGLPVSPLTGSSIIDDSSGTDQLAPAITATGSTGAGLKVFACWQDERDSDTDLYFAEVSSSRRTNVFVGDDGTNSSQSNPAIGINADGHPYLVWTDGRNANPEIYYAGSTYTESNALESSEVYISAGATVGTQPATASSADDVSIIVPAGAYSCDIKITISRVKNPPKFTLDRFSIPYDFGPSGINFDQPVTITIPYEVLASGNSPSAYWYNSLTGTHSQQGITDVESIVISPTLHAVRFKTTHFTQFFVGGSSSGGSSSVSGGGGGGGGGCSMSRNQQGSLPEFLLPYIVLSVVMVIIRYRDARNRTFLQYGKTGA